MLYLLILFISFLGFINSSLTMEMPETETIIPHIGDGWIDQCAHEKIDSIAMQWRNLFNPQKNKHYRAKWHNYCQANKEAKMLRAQFDKINSEIDQAAGDVAEKTANDIYNFLRIEKYKILEKIVLILSDMKQDIESISVQK